MTDPPDHLAPRRALDVARTLRVTLAAAALLTLLLTAFAWPISELRPRSLPIAVAGPTIESVGEAAAGLEAAIGEGGVEVVEVDGREGAVTAIEGREVYGALVIGESGAEMLTATAASPMVAQMLSGAASGEAGARGSDAATVTDVVPTAAGDPSGAVFNAAALPLAIGGVLIGALTSLLLPSLRDRLVAAPLAAAVSGLALTGVLQGGFDALGGNYWANASVIALGILAVATLAIGLYRLIGRPGIAIVAVLIVLLANPLSGVATAPELLPLGSLGQVLPPGAAGSALRGTAFFDGAGTGQGLTILLCWMVAGVVVAMIARARTQG